MAERHLSEKLHDLFEDEPAELVRIDVVRGLRWNVDAEKQARLRCITVPTGIEGPGRKLQGENEYPRAYHADLAWQVERPDEAARLCVASSAWIVQEEGGELTPLNRRMRQYDAVFDPFDPENDGLVKAHPQGEVYLFRQGFIDPDIFTPDGVAGLLDTRPDPTR